MCLIISEGRVDTITDIRSSSIEPSFTRHTSHKHDTLKVSTPL